MEGKNGSWIDALPEITGFGSKGLARKQLDWRPGLKLAFIPKSKGVLMIPVPDREALVGIARGANLDNYRDRNDRF